MLLFLAFLIGMIAGLRAMTAPAAIAWAAALGWFDVSQTPLAFMGYRWTPWVFTLLAVVELITDQLPSTPSRKVPMQFAARLIMGALTGATIGTSGGSLVGGLIAGVVGAAVGTFGGAAARGKLAAAFGKDTPAALIEDAVAIIGALIIVGAV
ncbi:MULTISPECIES: DUF4126 domain-containing protein [unclassified Rhizobium]|uniref:DUF4126 domain-containing protein n=1 Tax=unclassified Rhizobium TaxID=2613769 RepID=UPI00104D5E95|nr:MULTISPECIES: DUF4126 domain-containing protein [unclassified Rhizobium]MBB3393528.1 putative membrane protein [Rhizobium sp. BK060]MBB4166244.1 putative membrane protein [Rhizobium sp. BK538]TCM81866.1 putative membrane protein [Rhizobium sp. BK068]